MRFGIRLACVFSSEDEIDIVLHGTPEQKRKLAKQVQGQQSSSEDEFEKEMRLELDGIIKTTMNKAGLIEQQFYGLLLFSS